MSCSLSRQGSHCEVMEALEQEAGLKTVLMTRVLCDPDTGAGIFSLHWSVCRVFARRVTVKIQLRL